VVRRVNRYAIEAASSDRSRLLKPLLVAVVAPLAKRLMVCRVPKKFVVAAMRLNVIDYLGGNRVALHLVHYAQRMFLQISLTVRLPAASITPFGCGFAFVFRHLQ
jgi:hypothetical protein